jgi:hypothetical protein
MPDDQSLTGSPCATEVEVQSYSCGVPVYWGTSIAVFSPVICLEHEKALGWPLDARCIPVLIPGMLRPIVEDLGRTIGGKTESANKEVTFDRYHVPIRGGVLSVYPTELKPASVPHQPSSGQTKSGGPINCYPVLVLHHSGLNGPEELIAAAEHQIVLFVWVNVY